MSLSFACTVSHDQSSVSESSVLVLTACSVGFSLRARVASAIKSLSPSDRLVFSTFTSTNDLLSSFLSAGISPVAARSLIARLLLRSTLVTLQLDLSISVTRSLTSSLVTLPSLQSSSVHARLSSLTLRISMLRLTVAIAAGVAPVPSSATLPTELIFAQHHGIGKQQSFLRRVPL